MSVRLAAGRTGEVIEPSAGRTEPIVGHDVRIVIITGLSGAGKSNAIHVFEDLGHFCVDNLPPALLPRFAELVLRSEGRVDRIAIVVDIRSGAFFDDLEAALRYLDDLGMRYQILFLDASDEALVRRFKETRRMHPLAPDGSLLDGIHAERERLRFVRERSHRILDTSDMSVHALREELRQLFQSPSTAVGIKITVESFGYKHGVPIDVDLVFDVRFLPNPHYVPRLQPNTGLDPEVRVFVLQSPQAIAFRDRLFDMVEFLLPHFVAEGRSHVTIAIGCTGGQHRSVAMAEILADHLRARGYESRPRHRDIDRR
ncbi:MAG: RNase adapter RapZ [Armatimonadetes bacterium]|nr:RNase adapter RapZ [Armatimonadota bacterium]